MDKVIATLYSIEERAQRIMDTTSNEKAALKESFELKKAAFLKESDRQTEEKIADLTRSLQDNYDAELARGKEETKVAIDNLTRDFNENHSKVAKALFKQLIEV